MLPERRIVKVTLADGHSWQTDINGSKEEIRAYFRIGSYISSVPKPRDEDNLQKITSVAFLGPILMTTDRARYLVQAAREKAVHGPWIDQIEKVMTPSDRQAINAIWMQLPGSACFADALHRVERPELSRDQTLIMWTWQIADQWMDQAGDRLPMPSASELAAQLATLTPANESEALSAANEVLRMRDCGMLTATGEDFQARRQELDAAHYYHPAYKGQSHA